MLLMEYGQTWRGTDYRGSAMAVRLRLASFPNHTPKRSPYFCRAEEVLEWFSEPPTTHQTGGKLTRLGGKHPLQLGQAQIIASSGRGVHINVRIKLRSE